MKSKKEDSKSGRTTVLYVMKSDAKYVKELLENANRLNKEFRMVRASDDLIAIPVTQQLTTSEENDVWSNKVVTYGDHECPYSTSRLGNGRLDINKDLTLVQQGLWNFLKQDLSTLPFIQQLNTQTCPKKLELLGDDRTLIITRKGFCIEDASFRSLVGDQDLTLLWKNLAEIFGSPRVARRGDIDPDSPIRESGHELLWPISGRPDSTGPGSPAWITITEQGIRQSLDLTRVMFSRGNITEKIRFANLVQEGEVILDMYAGIGYYTLPALVHGRAAHVHACEWNDDAALALRHNLKANKVDDRATVYAGDCREVAITHSLIDICDRVCLGLLPSCEGGWRTAIKALRRNSGGWLHIHGNVPGKEQESWAFWVCQSLVQISSQEVSNDWIAICFHVERVKSYAPNVYHLVADVRLGPKSCISTSGHSFEIDEVTAGVLDPTTGKVKISPFPLTKPSCALNKNGILHQEWLMENNPLSTIH